MRLLQVSERLLSSVVGECLNLQATGMLAGLHLLTAAFTAEEGSLRYCEDVIPFGCLVLALSLCQYNGALLSCKLDNYRLTSSA